MKTKMVKVLLIRADIPMILNGEPTVFTKTACRKIARKEPEKYSFDEKNGFLYGTLDSSIKELERFKTD